MASVLTPVDKWSGDVQRVGGVVLKDRLMATYHEHIGFKFLC